MALHKQYYQESLGLSKIHSLLHSLISVQGANRNDLSYGTNPPRTAKVYGGFSCFKHCMAISNRADATLRTPISSTPPQTHCVPFLKRSRKQSNTG